MNEINNLQFYNTALKLRELQLSLTASNIANQDTPNYKALGINFKEQLAAKLSGKAQGLERTSDRHFAGVNDFGGVSVQYVEGGQIKADGNSVNPHLEATKIAQERNMYNAALNFSKNSAETILNAMKFQ
ncbi:flagellar basal body rod protein FlgB [Photobacterium damselae]|uniref:flagellar basal body rod protein FlgB n=1 Tax=Photobacterium damselae TaxID=38293 RepID=UPI004069286E